MTCALVCSTFLMGACTGGLAASRCLRTSRMMAMTRGRFSVTRRPQKYLRHVSGPPRKLSGQLSLKPGTFSATGSMRGRLISGMPGGVKAETWLCSRAVFAPSSSYFMK